MEDKIIEIFKKYSQYINTELNIHICLVEEDWQNIAKDVVNIISPNTDLEKKLVKVVEILNSLSPKTKYSIIGGVSGIRNQTYDIVGIKNETTQEIITIAKQIEKGELDPYSPHAKWIKP